MDANGLRSFGVSWGRGLAPWRSPDGANPPRIMVERDPCHRLPALRLADRAAPVRFTETPTQASDVVLAPSIARDRFGNYVTWHSASATLYSVSAAADEFAELQPIAVPLPTSALPVRDVALGADDVLYVAGADGVWLIDMRARFAPFLLKAAGFETQRLAADSANGAWALDVTAGRVARITGLPLFTTGVDLLRERNSRFEAVEPAPRPPGLRILGALLGAGERAVSLAANGDLIAVLVVGAQRAGLRVLAGQRWSAPIYFEGPRFPHSLALLDAGRFAVIGQLTAQSADGTPQPNRDLGAFTYALDAALVREARAYPGAVIDPLAVLGDYYPLTGRVAGPFANAAPGSNPAAYFPRLRRFTYGAGTLELAEPAPLARLSLAARAAHGVAANFAQEQDAESGIRAAVGLIDTRNPATEWHRLYLEGSVPRGTAMIIWLATSDGEPPAFTLDRETRNSANASWFPHVVGDVAALPRDLELPAAPPRAAWIPAASEVPSGVSLLGGDREPGISGLFTVLVQRAGLTVRTLKGRRLWAVAELFGDGRASPELVALRAYAGRVSYRDRYLPALYREQVFGAEAERPGRATGADFLERYIDLFEGVFTNIEDRVANAHLVTDVAACPPEALPWLGSWIGYALEDLRGKDAARRARNMLLNAPALARRHGTLDGLRWSLDIATDGGVTRGRLVVVENFRLRRTLATILGADLADEDDPLTLGITQSGNSFVGDSLFLGDENAKTFLALFRTLMPDPQATSYEAQRQRDEREAALHALYDGLAQRATVLVHESTDADELRRVRRLAVDAAPAHVAVSVIAAKYPFIVAVASLVGADTYVRAAERPDAVRVGASQLGYLDTLQGTGTLDAAHGSFGALGATLHDEPPVADAGPDREVNVGTGFTLDGSASRAAPGRVIDEYRWRLLPPSDT